MATQATSYESYHRAGWGPPQRLPKGAADPFHLRPLPNEDVYFYRKQIDNSRLVRQADPRARARAWKWMFVASACLFLLIALCSPGIHGILAGYRIEDLKLEQERLLAERAALEVEEARLLSPERLEELARIQEFIDPEPGQVVYLNPKADGSLALNVPSR